MVLAASDNGMNFILGGIIDISNPAAVRPGYVVLNGEIISTFLLAGMPPDGVLQAVNSSGVFFGQRGEAPNNSPYVPMNQLFLLKTAPPPSWPMRPWWDGRPAGSGSSSSATRGT